MAVVAKPPGVRPGAGRRSMRSRTVSGYARRTRVSSYRQNTYADSDPASPDTSDTVTDAEWSVGNTWVWKRVTARSTYLMYAGLGDLVGVSLA